MVGSLSGTKKDAGVVISLPDNRRRDKIHSLTDIDADEGAKARRKSSPSEPGLAGQVAISFAEPDSFSQNEVEGQERIMSIGLMPFSPFPVLSDVSRSLKRT
jgi:hypothetical protein